MAVIRVGRGSPVSPVRWLRAVAVIGATALLMASSCSWQIGHADTRGGAAARRAIRCPRSTPTPRAGPPINSTPGRRNARPPSASRSPRSRRTPTRRGSPRWRTRSCHLAWTTLAGIGMVESHHGTYRGAVVAPNGDVTPPIRGVRLDGSMGNMQIPDTDGGKLDGDPHHGPGHGAHAVHPRDVEALRRRRQQRRHRSAPTTSTTRRCRRRAICAGAARTSRSRAAGWTRCAPTTCPTSTPARSATGPRPTPTATRSRSAESRSAWGSPTL